MRYNYNCKSCDGTGLQCDQCFVPIGNCGCPDPEVETCSQCMGSGTVHGYDDEELDDAKDNDYDNN